MPIRSFVPGAIKNHLFFDAALVELILIEGTHGAAEYIGQPEIVVLIEVGGGAEFDLKDASPQVDLEKIYPPVAIVRFRERSRVELDRGLGQFIVHLVDEGAADAMQFDCALQTKPIHLTALRNQLAVGFADRFDGLSKPGQAIRPVPFPFRGKSKQCVPSLYPEYSAPPAGSNATVVDLPVLPHWQGIG